MNGQLRTPDGVALHRLQAGHIGSIQVSCGTAVTWKAVTWKAMTWKAMTWTGGAVGAVVFVFIALFNNVEA